MLYALNAQPFNANDWDWAKPGKVFRCMNLNTNSALESVDFCVDMNIDYMMFDAGWYGLGYGQSKENNPASNPLVVINGLDMETVTNYAAAKGIGVILYVNKVAWYNYDNQAMFDLYESWGIKGLKLGFVDGYSATGNQKVYGIIQEAANRKMLINVHDNFRPTGLIQKYPNLMTAEGVRGNEAIANTGDHNSLIPYTRMLTGATDFTICYLGNDPEYKRPSSLATTRAHQLAMSVMMYSPLQHVFWYAIPGIYHNPDEIELFTKLPVVWDDFK
ncbi:MAG TPA: glycoside hydrolase family 97 catalytic domain-containing protein, partial [Marinilabiliaceae bacterium]|nr:glycoside hydrolase family 97 catalytic domain-containing protein [Marinilabiliaceae bacterium]